MKNVNLANVRSAIGLTMRGGDDDFDGKIQVAYHPLDDGCLLKILGPEHRDVRRDDIEKFRHDRRDTAKMRGTRCALHAAGQ